MKFKFGNIIVTSFFTALFLSACYYDNLEDLHPAPIVIPGLVTPNSGCDTVKDISYQTDILPIFISNCGSNNSCHNSNSNSGYDLSTYEGTLLAKDLLISSITWDGTVTNMPQNSSQKLNDCYIAIIKKWVNTGAQP
ncbi:MAG: hypothetical protein IT238_05320 [Bacteroidia bacterium]|nr:hypothetical protein [Bacteroidia bacterium]MCZ2249765.1 hypothetical protein [Bacteroidia bacterium]